MHRADHVASRFVAAIAAAMMAVLPTLLAGATIRAEEPRAAAAGLDQRMEEVSREVEEIRGLEFLRAVPVETIGDDEARAHVLRRIERFRAREVLEAQQRALARMGVLPEGTDILESYLLVLEEQAGGYYDPETGGFYLLDDMPESILGMLIAHELTHAVEDQHFDLDRRLERLAVDDDGAFAVGAVHEGSAMLVMTAYLARAAREGRRDPSAMMELGQTEAARGERLAEMPTYLARSLLGPYLLGARFLTRGKFPAGVPDTYPLEDVARVYRQGPTSSEQILHPEKYWDENHRDPPVPVDLHAVDRALGRGWSRTADGVLGELGLAVLVGNDAPVNPAGAGLFAVDAWTHPAAAGWGGDRWGIWARGDRELVVLRTVWDTEDDAAEFLEAVRSESADAIWQRRERLVAGVWGARGLSDRKRARLERALAGE